MRLFDDSAHRARGRLRAVSSVGTVVDDDRVDTRRAGSRTTPGSPRLRRARAVRRRASACKLTTRRRRPRLDRAYDCRNSRRRRAVARQCRPSLRLRVDARRSAPRDHRTFRPDACCAAWAGLIALAIVWGQVLVATHHHLDLGGATVLEPRPLPSERASRSGARRRRRVRTGPATAHGNCVGGRLLAATAATCSGVGGRGGVCRRDGDATHRSRALSSQRLPADRARHRFVAHLPVALRRATSPATRRTRKGHPPGMVVIEWICSPRSASRAPGGTRRSLSRAGRSRVAALVATAARWQARTGARAAAPFMVLRAGRHLVADRRRVLRRGFGDGDRRVVVAASGAEEGAPSCSWRRRRTSFGVTAFLVVRIGAARARSGRGVRFRRGASRPLVVAAIGALPVFVVFAGSASRGSRDSRRRATNTGPASRMHRPYSYFLVADLALFAVATGPAVAVGLRRLRDQSRVAARRRGAGGRRARRSAGMSKGEVERIWLPFVPWAVLAPRAVGRAGRRDRLSSLAGGPSCVHARGRGVDMVAVVSPGEHVLVVEDDPTVREVVVRYLEHAGHRGDGGRRRRDALSEAARVGPTSSCST